jgi:hypothetical protein
MKNLFIKKLVSNTRNIEEAAHLLETKAVTNLIDILNWDDFPYKPNVQFRIAHTGKEIWLKYYVNEKHILAKETRTNGDVYKDSTVEFFVSFDKKNYYNFEFSCIGTIHLAYGPGRQNRKFIAPETVEKIEIQSTLGNQPFEEKSGNFEWEMMIRIPLVCFAFDTLKTLNGIKATANFYKCGDETKEPHYITWNPIQTKNPDYHRPEFFGNVEFE